jgi:hypothetical protein
MDQTKRRLPRCPNGTTRNKKTGNCEPKAQAPAQAPVPQRRQSPQAQAQAQEPPEFNDQLDNIMELIDSKIMELKRIRKEHINYINTYFPDLRTNNAETEHFDMMYDRWLSLNLEDLTVERAKKFIKKTGNKKNKPLIMGLYTDELLRNLKLYRDKFKKLKILTEAM